MIASGILNSGSDFAVAEAAVHRVASNLFGLV
jgi:hypothetical protein